MHRLHAAALEGFEDATDIFFRNARCPCGHFESATSLLVAHIRLALPICVY